MPVQAVLFAGLLGCTSVDPATVSEDGRLLSDLPPIPYRIALAPFGGQGLGAGGRRLGFVYQSNELHGMLEKHLAALNVATEVFSLDATPDPEAPKDIDPTLWKAIRARADLLVRANIVESPQMASEGWSDRWPIAVGLTAFTGPGQDWVESATYHAKFGVDFTVESPRYLHPIGVVACRIDRQELDHWDRHGVFSVATLASVLIPSFLMWDDDATTAQALSDKICSAVAARLAKYLKIELGAAQSRFLGELHLDQSAIPSRPGRVPIRGKISARNPVHALDLWVDAETEPRIQLGRKELGEATEQRRVGGYEATFDRAVDLPAGRHLLQFEMVIRGQRTSRTVAVTLKEPPQ
jgi:hypothetical protein